MSKQPQTFVEHVISWAKTIIGAIIIVMFVNGALVASFVVPTGSMEETVRAGDFLFVNKFIYGPSTPQIVPFLNTPLPFYKFPGLREPERGDVIVFIFPGNREQVEAKEFTYYLKRCVAVAGDTISMVNKKLIVNGEEHPLPEHALSSNFIRNDDSYNTFPPGRGFTRDNYGPLRVPKAGDVITLTAKNFREWNIFIKREGNDCVLRDGKWFIEGQEASEYVVKNDYVFGIGDNRDNSLDSRYWGFIPVENVVGTPIMVYWSWESAANSIMDKLSSVRFGRIGTLID